MTVAVLSAPSGAACETLDPRDLRVEWFSGTGKGGQHRNKHQNCCRLIHVPSGLVQTAVGRERQANYREAHENLARRLAEQRRSSAHTALNAARRDQVGSGERGDKIRTYRSQDDRVTDHRTGRMARYADVMGGDFSQLVS